MEGIDPGETDSGSRKICPIILCIKGVAQGLEETAQICNDFRQGLRDGIPIGLGYVSVAFAFGIMAVEAGLPVWAAAAISMTNVTSAGQFAGLSLMTAASSLGEMALTQLVINLRYALMSLSLSQKLHPSVGFLDRLLIAFVNTDEVFAVASSQKAPLGKRYLLGLILTPYFGWALGTVAGAAAGTLLPEALRSALGIAIYGMFIAIVIPPARYLHSVRAAAGLAALLSCAFAFLPLLERVSDGFSIILSTVLAAGLAALLFPVEEKQEDNP